MTKLEQAFLFCVAGISVVISLGGLFGVFGALPILAEKLPSLSLLVLGIVAGYLAFERRTALDRINRLITEGFEEIRVSLRSGPIVVLKDSEEVYSHLARRIGEAQTSVDDLTWGDLVSTVQTQVQEVAFERYAAELQSAASRESLTYREVMTFPVEGKLREERLTRVRRILAESPFGYALAYYKLDHVQAPPLMQFTIIDSEEVVITFYRGHNLPSKRETHLAIRDPHIALLFQDYFEAIWTGAIPLKRSGGEPNWAELRQLETSGE